MADDTSKGPAPAGLGPKREDRPYGNAPQKPRRASTKVELLELLHGVRLAFLYGCFVHDLSWKVCNVETAAQKGGEFVFKGKAGEVALSLPLMAKAMRENPRVVESNFVIMLEQQTLRLTYELVLDYCEATKQQEKYALEPMLQFARVWRNVASHGVGSFLREWPQSLWNKNIRVVKWRDQELSSEQVGTDIALDVFHLLHLQEDIYQFCQTELS